MLVSAAAVARVEARAGRENEHKMRRSVIDTAAAPNRQALIVDNTGAIALYLKKRSRLAWVNYAGLEDHPDPALVKRQMGGLASGIVSFGLKFDSGQLKSTKRRR